MTCKSLTYILAQLKVESCYYSVKRLQASDVKIQDMISLENELRLFKTEREQSIIEQKKSDGP